MTATETRRGPWYLRTLVWTFSTALGILVFWLLGFVVNDIGSWPGPDYSIIERQTLAADVVSQREALTDRIERVNDSITATQDRINALRDSTDSAEQTLNRLLEIQRLSIEKERALSEAESQALAEVKSLFLSNQQQFQVINQELATHKDDRRTLQKQADAIDETLDLQRADARETYDQLSRRHDIRMAIIKMAVLVPLFLLAIWAHRKWRTSLYRKLIDAVALATAVKIGFVMHEHFPTRAFKYILVGVAIIVVTGILIRLLKRIGRPPAEVLRRQYREAYEHMTCPVCEYPTRRGPLRYLYWNRRSVGKLRFASTATESPTEEPYVCPACTTPLFATCGACGKVRPTLMPACPHCGDVQAVDTDTPD